MKQYKNPEETGMHKDDSGMGQRELETELDRLSSKAVLHYSIEKERHLPPPQFPNLVFLCKSVKQQIEMPALFYVQSHPIGQFP